MTLDALIRRTVARLLRSADGHPSDALLFLGNRHNAFPALLVQDPVLEPVDKVVWMVVCQHGQVSGTGAAFPRYDEIARLANVASTSTVSRAIAILRTTRWLSLCARVRDGGGRFRGNVYALHDEPLPLADAVHLDPDYMAFLQSAVAHHHRRVRKVAAATLSSLDDDIRDGEDILSAANPIEQRLAAARTLARRGTGRYFQFSESAMAQLCNHPSASGMHQDQKSKAAAARLRNSHPQKSKSVCRSSSYIKTTTTKNPRARHSVAVDEGLIYPKRLSANQRAIAARYLEQVPGPQRQIVLDELEGRFRAEQQGAKPVYDELRYLHHLCRQVPAGAFQPNLGLKVQQARDDRAQAAAQRQRDAQACEAERRERTQRRRERSTESPLAEARKLLGMRPAKRTTPDKG